MSILISLLSVPGNMEMNAESSMNSPGGYTVH